MKESPEFIGRAYGDDEKAELSAALEKWSAESSEPIEDELEKTEEEIKMIAAINSIIAAEQLSLGIEGSDPVSPQKIHFLPDKIFSERFPGFKGNAFFRSTDDAVYVNQGRVDNKARTFAMLLHELVHRASTTKFYVDQDDVVHDARVGYRISSPWKEPGRQNRLRGFNELMVDNTVYKLLLRNQKILESDFGIGKEDVQGPIYTYMHYGPILDSILLKVAADKGIAPKEVFNDLERGQFEGNILVLKDIERSFGEGSLEILSLLETLESQNDNDGLEEMIKDFFAEQDLGVRQSMRADILAFVDGAVQSRGGQGDSV